MAVNQYGLDVSYFKNCIKRDFIQSGIGNYTPDEFARICLRMAVTADAKVLLEPEFTKHVGVTDYWYNHYCTEHCTLCGNSGVIDSRGVCTAAGVPVGRLNYCICPNGQAMRLNKMGELNEI